MSDKLKKILINREKTLLFLLIILVIGIIFGSFLVVVLNTTDKTLIGNYIDTYLSNIQNNKLDYKTGLINVLISNESYILISWLLGISIIGFPITILLFFYKAFAIGFTLSSIIMKYHTKGLLLVFTYLLPHHLINIITYLYLATYSLTTSFKIIRYIIRKQAIDFRSIINKYQISLMISSIIISITGLFEIFITPMIIKTIIILIK
jgi:stage II sporulation protein M